MKSLEKLSLTQKNLFLTNFKKLNISDKLSPQPKTEMLSNTTKTTSNMKVNSSKTYVMVSVNFSIKANSSMQATGNTVNSKAKVFSTTT